MAKSKAPLNAFETATVNFLNTLISAANGQFFRVVFIKADGSERTMTCRTGVTKHLKGGENTSKDYSHLKTVFEMSKDGYKNINLTTVKLIVINGKEYTFGDKA